MENEEKKLMVSPTGGGRGFQGMSEKRAENVVNENDVEKGLSRVVGGDENDAKKILKAVEKQKLLNAKLPGRSPPQKIKRAVELIFGERRGFPGCWKPAEALHHLKRFAIVKRHVAEEIVPLCRIHHELAHAGAIQGEQGDLKKWRLKLERQTDQETEKVDAVVRKRRLRRRW